MTRAPIRCGVAGVGYLGQHHARLYASLPGSELVGVYDVDATRAQKIAKKHKCAVFSSLEALAQACDAVSVVVPTPEHASTALPLIQAGCHVLIEKPLCTSLEEAQAIMQAAQTHGVYVQVGHIEHFNPVMGFLEEKVHNPRFLQSERLAPFSPRGTEVGVVLDLMIHDIGILLALVPSPIASIEAIGVSVLSSTEDLANARIKFENGCIATLNASRVSLKKLRKLRVFQPHTYLSLDFMAQEGALIRKQGDSVQRETLPVEKAEPLAVELSAFLACICKKTSPRVDAALGRSALAVALTITEQIQAS